MIEHLKYDNVQYIKKHMHNTLTNNLNFFYYNNT